MNVRTVLLAVSFVFGALVSARGGGAPDPPEAVIRSLYAHHQPARHREIDTCRRTALAKYCDARLTDLFLKDCACAKKTHEVCHLDWDPFYDAQDFGGENPNPRIRRIGDSNAFEVTITNLGDTTLTYELTKTSDGWRIANIRTPKWNLVDVLSK